MTSLTFKQLLWCYNWNILGKLAQYHGCWCPGSFRHQAISSQDIDCGHCGHSPRTWEWISPYWDMSMWRNDMKWKYVFMIYQKNSEWQGLTLGVLTWLGENENLLAFSIIYQHSHDVHDWNHSPWKIWIWLSYIVNSTKRVNRWMLSSRCDVWKFCQCMESNFKNIEASTFSHIPPSGHLKKSLFFQSNW